jgi:polyhydroxybutyrate depolymerase
MTIHLLLSVFVSCTVLFSCKKNNTTSDVYGFNDSIRVGNIYRTYTVRLPPDYYAATDFSLVIALHGGGGNAAQFETSSRLSEKANAEKFIVVYPEGVRGSGILAARTWNAGSCCGGAVSNNINDVEFISLLIDKLVAGYKVNPKRIYATGHSNGGMLAYRLACELSGKIAAIAPNGCTMVAQTCSPARPVPVLHMHSVLDTNIPYQGGTGSGLGTMGLQLPSLDSVLNVWSLKNSCTNSAVIADDSRYKITTWTSCSGNVTLLYYLTKDGGHAWPGGLAGGPFSDTPSSVINANNLLWDFFRQFQLP